MKRLLIGVLVASSILVAAPARADHPHPATTPQCRPNAVHHVTMRLARQEAAGHDRRCNRMERHLVMLELACDAPAG